SYFALKNLNCPPDVLRTILERGNDDKVSEYASHNPNCPIETKIRWMQATGQIGKEDPSKHIIEKEKEKEKEPVDEDLEKLRSLVSKRKFNLKKYAEENYYTSLVARNPIIIPSLQYFS
ncbi:unnamed protein product, partial [marine sediment metagenome]